MMHGQAQLEGIYINTRMKSDIVITKAMFSCRLLTELRIWKLLRLVFVI